MNYKKLYNSLYDIGYQGQVNIGKKYVDYLCKTYDFDSVLDIGCSQGNALLEYQKNEKKVIGIDISEKAIEECKKKGLKECYVESAITLPFKRNSVDAVVTTDVLEHLEYDDIIKTIWNVCRITRKWFFVKVSKSKEGVTKWIDTLHNKGEFLEVDNLHLTTWDWDRWINVIEGNSHLKFLKKYNKMLIFKKEGGC